MKASGEERVDGDLVAKSTSVMYCTAGCISPLMDAWTIDAKMDNLLSFLSLLASLRWDSKHEMANYSHYMHLVCLIHEYLTEGLVTYNTA
jgi:hypothetical protein